MFGVLRNCQVYGGCAEQLKRYNINVSPPEQIWVEVDKKDGVVRRDFRSVFLEEFRLIGRKNFV